jgi:hypothetical protein
MRTGWQSFIPHNLANVWRWMLNSLSFRKIACQRDWRRGFALLLIVLTALGGPLFLAIGQAQNNPAVPSASVSEQSSFALQKTARNEDVFVIYRDEKGESVCRIATPEERRSLSRRGEAGPTRTIYPGGRRPWMDDLNAAAPSATEFGTPLLPSAGLRIVLHGTQQLQDNPTARDAFIVAANRWEALISTPITVVLDVDFGTTIFGDPFPSPNTLGSTSSATRTAPLSTVRQQLVNNAPGPEELQLYNALPDTVLVELNGSTTSASQIRMTRTTSRALGLSPDIPNPDFVMLGDGDAGIGFNSAHSFDFNPNDGITSGALDFDAVVVHEIGHALGFISNSGNGITTPVSIWDLFRFRPGTANLGTMATAPRVMSEGGTQVFFNNRTNSFGTTELGLSTGGSDGVGGDGEQSSHWKDDVGGNPFIGIMDPVLRSGRRELLTENDLKAIDTFGYTIGGTAPPPPPPPPAPANDNFSAAVALSGASGTVTGTNVGATGEVGEPNHAQATGSGRRSVWYDWTAPANGQINFNTSGSSYDTVLGIYTGAAVSALTEIASNDDVDPTVILHSSVSFNAVAGTTYRIAVDGFQGDTGGITLNWSDSTPHFTISGTISSACCDQSTDISNITVTLSGQQAAATQTDAGGFYRFLNLATGNYTVTPSKLGVVFTPTSTTFNNLSQNQRADFTAARLTFRISGQARDLQSNPIAGATVVMSKQVPGSPIGIPVFNTTDGAGNFSFTADPGANYSVSISKPGYVFLEPRSITFNNLSANQSVTFTARRPTISGHVMDGSGGVISGATVTLSGAQARVTTTGADGSYSFEDLPRGNYILSPSKVGHVAFAQSVSDLDSDRQIDLLLIPIITISGRVTDASGTGLGTAGIQTNNSFFVRPVNADGSYSIGISPNPAAPVTITPVKYGYTFAPASVTFNSVSGGNQVVNFSGTLRNPIDGSLTFVEQNYQDFLNRQPDAAGVAFWTNGIESCGPSVPCTEVKRIDTSAAFFLSIEFQETGYLVYRLYKAAYGDLAGSPFPVRRAEFLPDTQTIGSGVVVGQAGWQQVLETNTQNFILGFVTRPGFATANPTTTTPTEFVNQLFVRAGVTPSAADRQAAINEFGTAPTSSDAAARARALRRVAENSLLKAQEFNKAFVLMQYFGYLQRNPDDAPDNSLAGYNFWLNKLNQFNGDFRQAEMVKAFITSSEYRGRFGTP